MRKFNKTFLLLLSIIWMLPTVASATGLRVKGAAAPPPCLDTMIVVDVDGNATILGSDLENGLIYPLSVKFSFRPDAIAFASAGASTVIANACDLIGLEDLTFTISTGGPIQMELCNGTISFVAAAPDITGIDTTIYCLDSLRNFPSPGRDLVFPCGDPVATSFAFDWNPSGPTLVCDLLEDTVEVIYREYEAQVKGVRYKIVDTLHVLALPLMTTANLFCLDMDTIYCGVRSPKSGPYFVYPSLYGSDCDTLFFMDGLDADCGIFLAEKSGDPAGTCDIMTAYTLTVKQTCAHESISSTCSVDPPEKPFTRIGTGQHFECSFWIVDIDTLAPVITLQVASGDTTAVSTSTLSCTTNSPVPPATVTDQCRGVLQVKAMVDGKYAYPLELVNGVWKSASPLGLPASLTPFKVVYEASDSCGNTSFDSIYLRVEDQVKPSMACYQQINVPLGQDKKWIPVSSLDNGSDDNCALQVVVARRKDWRTFCVDLCDSLETRMVTSKGTILAPWLSNNMITDPVEVEYNKSIDWFSNDGLTCGALLTNAWNYDLMKYATVDCADSMDAQTFDQAAAEVFAPGTNIDELRAIGGGWGMAVPVSCDDVCNTVTVEVLAMDFWCNWNKCWLNVLVEDKTAPLVVREVTPQVEISCKTYSELGLDTLMEQAAAGNALAKDKLDLILGGYDKVRQDALGGLVDVNGDPVISELTLQDSICHCVEASCTYSANAKKLSQGAVLVHCPSSVLCTQEVFVGLNSCGLGIIKRRFTFSKECPDGSATANVAPVVREQIIHVGLSCELTLGMFSLPPDAEVLACDVIFDPSGSGNVIGAAHPDSTGRLVYTFGEQCRNVAIGYKDKVLELVGVEGGCKRIMRTWSYMDMCDPSGAMGSYVQKILLKDTVPPTVEILPIGTVSTAGACEALLNATANIFDACGVVRYTWELRNLTQSVFVASDAGFHYMQMGSALQIAPSTLLSTGNYELRLRVEDQCGIESFAAQEFTVATGQKPMLNCISSLSTDLIPMSDAPESGMATLWADKFASKSVPACNDTHVEYFIERKDGINDDTLDPEDGKSVDFTCADLANSPIQLRLWARSMPSGSADFCDVFGMLQNNKGGCSATAALGSTFGVTSEVIDEFKLYQNNPNPFTNSTEIGFSIPRKQEVSISIYDVTGRMIVTKRGVYEKGMHKLEIDRSELGVSSGLLYYQLDSENFTSTRKMILVN